jgi:hypothetical protein
MLVYLPLHYVLQDIKADWQAEKELDYSFLRHIEKLSSCPSPVPPRRDPSICLYCPRFDFLNSLSPLPSTSFANLKQADMTPNLLYCLATVKDEKYRHFFLVDWFIWWCFVNYVDPVAARALVARTLDSGFESRLRHGYLSSSFYVVLSYVGRGLATGLITRPRSPTICWNRLGNQKIRGGEDPKLDCRAN